ncbi:twin-arginine translocase subunit TatB [Malaciobacter molluscorum LMG 25693]|uniref:Sec-independent protein translocase protein TatB homolog n=1 Tax=Malaciobacter molluscorum LMG 25693 TaxID=870501 RepID=A0A2G1DKI2_9BACT|nr:Sec-independent protein translocase protein TatB [Malaciobacter molluscorum]AXX92556.1 twin arginine translocation system, TatB protein [Malaciobacter molluscorum LMG 25693]PHO18981.1 twin-arginine translocase subunit TatB [Malaciobacter molluscorum LMG 25693]
MFGMGFFEILLVAVIAIIALGPEKLPKAMVEVAKFMKKFKSGLDDAKSTIDNELNISEMREEANKFKAQIEDAKSSVNNNMNLGLNDIMNDDNDNSKKEDTKEVPLKKEKSKKKKKKVEQEEIKEEKTDAADKFKVNFEEADKKENK